MLCGVVLRKEEEEKKVKAPDATLLPGSVEADGTLVVASGRVKVRRHGAWCWLAGWYPRSSRGELALVCVRLHGLILSDRLQDLLEERR